MASTDQQGGQIPHSCKRPDVANMDHVIGYRPAARPIVNRMCLTCGTHWYGDAGNAVFEMPRRIWDGWGGGATP